MRRGRRDSRRTARDRRGGVTRRRSGRAGRPCRPCTRCTSVCDAPVERDRVVEEAPSPSAITAAPRERVVRRPRAPGRRFAGSRRCRTARRRASPIGRSRRWRRIVGWSAVRPAAGRPVRRSRRRRPSVVIVNGSGSGTEVADVGEHRCVLGRRRVRDAPCARRRAAAAARLAAPARRGCGERTRPPGRRGSPRARRRRGPAAGASCWATKSSSTGSTARLARARRSVMTSLLRRGRRRTRRAARGLRAGSTRRRWRRCVRLP